MPSMRIASPERRWRAAVAPLIAGWIGWILSGSVRLGLRPGTPPEVPLTPRIIASCLAVAVGLCLAALIMRSHLTVSDEGLADHRMFRVVRVPWHFVTGFEVDRPGSLWGGFCVAVVCRDGSTIDLMSTRAYSRVPSARHLDELRRICWSLEDAATKHAG
ncbi:MAG TPA: hypothetical protein VMU94_19220 [Streptosporangiaceae bacterium]|nr:hypothetical protein [Streptosporangiaceae bacterium]